MLLFRSSALVLALLPAPAALAQTGGWVLLRGNSGAPFGRVAGSGSVAQLSLSCGQGKPLMLLTLRRAPARNPAMLTVSVGGQSVRAMVQRTANPAIWGTVFPNGSVADLLANGQQASIAIDGMAIGTVSLAGGGAVLNDALTGCWAGAGSQTAPVPAGAPAAAPATAPRLSAAERTAVMRAAGYALRGRVWSTCDGMAQGDIEEMRDLDGDGRAEAIVKSEGTACYGMTGAGFQIVTPVPGGWRKVIEATGMPAFYPRPGIAWPDIELGGPGTNCFGFLRWNGQAYVQGGTSLEGRICTLEPGFRTARAAAAPAAAVAATPVSGAGGQGGAIFEDTRLPEIVRRDLADFASTCNFTDDAEGYLRKPARRGPPLAAKDALVRADFNGDGTEDYLLDSGKLRCTRALAGEVAAVSSLLIYTSLPGGGHALTRSAQEIDAYRVIPGKKAAIALRRNPRDDDPEDTLVAGSETISMTGPAAWSASRLSHGDFRLTTLPGLPAEARAQFDQWTRECAAAGRRLQVPDEGQGWGNAVVSSEDQYDSNGNVARRVPLDLNGDGRRDYVIDTETLSCGVFGTPVTPRPPYFCGADCVLIALVSKPDGSYFADRVKGSVSFMGNGDPAAITRVGRKHAIAWLCNVTVTWTGTVQQRSNRPYCN